MRAQEIYAQPEIVLFTGAQPEITRFGDAASKSKLGLPAARFQFSAVLFFIFLFLCNRAFGSSLTITLGQSVKVSVTADGTSPFTYQWYKNGTAISGATSADYVTPAATVVTVVNAPDRYKAKVFNAAAVSGVDSDEALLTVTAAAVPPAISNQPVAATVTAGQSATFSVAASGTGTLSYQWSKNGTAISGATSASYTTPTTTVADSGSTFSVIVTDSSNSLTTTSNAVTLTVTAAAVAPAITTQPVPVTVTAGQSAIFSVAASGTGTLSYQWSKNGTAISGATSASYTTPTTTVADSGSTFSVKVSNSGNSLTTTSNIVTLTVNAAPVAPAIVTQPVAVTVTAGQSASFSVSATGSGTLAYSWTKGGVAISGANSATYTISNTASTDTGSYAVVVTNSVSSVTSTSVSLTVKPLAPAITTQPAAQSITAGQSVSFTVVATGTGTLTYQWTKDGTAISGATAATYIIANAASGNAGNYAVVITNTVNSVSSSPTTSTAVSLTVNAAPVGPSITTQPTAQSVTAGQAVSFTVAATGSGTLSYQWTKNGTTISGANAATYTIASAASGNAGNYAVVVTNSVSSVTSTSVTLTVNAAPVGPSITTQPTAQSITAGQSVSFSVAATGSGTLTYQWAKGGVAIFGATSATYTVANASSGDAGNYAVVVTNSVSSVTSTSVSLTVNAAPVGPSITTQPAPQSVTVGQSVSFSVAATGSGTLSYQWTKGGVAIAGATSATITIASVANGDSGIYAVVVTNSVSSVTSTSVSLTVNAAPVGPSITTQPASQSVTAGQSVSFTVAATGSGTLTYQWAKNGASISGANSPTYTIASAATSDMGNYTVVVTNSVTSVTSSPATLIVSQGAVAPVPDGYASTATGGAAGQIVTVSTAADFKLCAQSTDAYVINVSGIINLGGSVTVKSNKTIQGLDGNSTIIGCLDLSSGGVSNVIIRGLDITNPGTTISNGTYTDGGDGITIRNASNVFVTHCTLFDCADDLIEISTGADNVTVSWSDFYYTTAQTVHRSTLIAGKAGAETKPLHVTLHHNFWSDRSDTNMPSGTYGYVHLYNNAFKATGNTSATDARDGAQFFVEQNAYEQIKDPLYKENVNTSQPAGRIRSISNLFTSCTGKAPDAGTDAIFTPPYSYELLLAADVTTVTGHLSGNIAGAASATPTGSGASITGPTNAVTGSTFTLTAAPSGFTGTSYQWRLNNFDIAGATSSTYKVASAQTADAGIYTVVIGLSAGDFVVSAPLVMVLGTTSGSSGSSSSSSSSSSGGGSGGSGGGGAPSFAYLAGLLALAAQRLTRRGVLKHR